MQLFAKTCAWHARWVRAAGPRAVRLAAFLRASASQVSAFLRADRESHVSGVVGEAQKADADHDSGRLFRCFRRLGAFKARPLPIVVDALGVPYCDSYAQAAAYQAHFAKLMRGKVVPPAELRLPPPPAAADWPLGQVQVDGRLVASGAADCAELPTPHAGSTAAAALVVAGVTSTGAVAPPGRIRVLIDGYEQAARFCSDDAGLQGLRAQLLLRLRDFLLSPEELLQLAAWLEAMPDAGWRWWLGEALRQQFLAPQSAAGSERPIDSGAVGSSSSLNASAAEYVPERAARVPFGSSSQAGTLMCNPPQLAPQTGIPGSPVGDAASPFVPPALLYQVSPAAGSALPPQYVSGGSRGGTRAACSIDAAPDLQQWPAAAAVAVTSQRQAVIRVPVAPRCLQSVGEAPNGPYSDAQAAECAAQLAEYVGFLCQVSLLICPTVQQLAWLFLSLKVGKAAGPDCLPSELVVAAAWQIARLVHPILVSALRLGREPLQWSGGLLAPLPKAKAAGLPDVRCCRPITISDSLAKGWHLWVRALLLERVGLFAHTTQCGGLLRRGTHFAAHMVRSFCMLAALTGESCAVFFGDLIAAFDSVVREIIMGGRLDPDALRRRLRALALEPDVVEAIVAYVAAGDLLQRAGVPEEVADLVRLVHNSTWFTSRGCDDLAITGGGTRAGNPLADLLFNLIAAGLFRVVRARLVSAGLVTMLADVAPVSCLHRPAGAAASERPFADVSYLDDVAFALKRKSAAALLDDLSKVVACVVGTCREFGFQLNFKAGKSEAIVSLVGPQSRSLRRKVLIDQRGELPCACAGSVVQLRVVPAYTHLGGVTCANGSLMPEFANRAASANAAYASLSKPVFARSDLCLHTKLAAAGAFVDSRLLMNAAVWHRPRSFAPLEKVRRKLSARILGVTLADHVSDRALWATMGSLPVDVLVRLRRLKYLPALFTAGPPELHSLIALCADGPQSWAGLLVEDFSWLRQQHVSFLGLPAPAGTAPELGMAAWARFIIDDPGRWIRRVRLVAQDEVARLRADVFAESDDPLGDARLAAGLARHFAQHRAAAGDDDPDDELTIVEAGQRIQHRCPECGSLFRAARLLGIHRRARHGVVSEARRFAHGTRCVACRTEFHSLPRLVQHLKRQHACLEHLRHFVGPLEPEAALEAQRVVAEARRAARRTGTPFLAAYLPAIRA